MGKLLLSFLISFALAVPAVHAEEIATPLKPSTKWNMHYAKASCQLIREFEMDGKKIVFSVLQSLGMTNRELVLITDRVKRSRAPTKISLRLGSSKEVIELNGFINDAKEKGRSIWRFVGITSDFFEKAAMKDVLTVKYRSLLTLSFELDVMPKAMKALEACESELMKAFGLDIDFLSGLKRQPEPVGNPGRWVNANDYPGGALRGNREGETVVKLTVQTDGSVSDCSILLTSGHNDLDKATCRNMMRRAKFTPALDATGRPISAPWVSKARWSIPR